ncbi:MAG: MFS transporter permease [Gammaproteobacteria bacterium HGW-Gammaproteobacteria-15]|nr:MAG: MFS transporter permease [Gammaproteobacteria bacterium HGW-Gammaproteobacteria-15]
MNSYASYQLQDFIPFSADVYFRLLERISETWWPLHLLGLALGAAALLLALKKRDRLVWLLIAPVWAFVAAVFFMQHYAQLNWAGHYVGYAFLAQAILLLLLALAGVSRGKVPAAKMSAVAGSRPAVIMVRLGIAIGFGIALTGLLALPLMAPLSGAGWWQAQVFGLHADPTAITTLGLALMLLWGWRLWLVAFIPMLWLLLSGLTLSVLQATEAWLVFPVLAAALVGIAVLCRYPAKKA